MKTQHDDVLLDRGLLMSFALRRTAGHADAAAEYGLDEVAGHYRRMLYECFATSAIEEVLHKERAIADKLVALPRAGEGVEDETNLRPVVIPIDEAERSLLSNTVRSACRLPNVLQAVQWYEKEKGGPARPSSDVVGYVVRMLLLAREYTADIFPWALRMPLIESILDAAAIERKRIRLGKALYLLVAEPCRFPYVPPLPKQDTSPTRFAIVVHTPQAGRPRGKQETHPRDADEHGNKPCRPSTATVFISYSHRDEKFARKLHRDLQERGIRCWFAPEKMRIGQDLWDTIDEAIQKRDMLLLVLSKHSLDSPWVEDEVKKAYAQERSKRKTLLVPLRIDDAIMRTCKPWATKLRANRMIGDFRKWQSPSVYTKALARLLESLRAKADDGTK